MSGLAEYKKFAVFENKETGDRFISWVTPGKDPTITDDGKVSYNVLFTSDSDDECRENLQGCKKQVFILNEENRILLARLTKALVDELKKDPNMQTPELMLRTMRIEELYYYLARFGD
jgi:hypothetical protein